MNHLLMKPYILISNDDGYQAKGLHSLVSMLRDMADIIVCAPDGPRSGYATAFSATQPLRLRPISREEGVEVWACNGTPVDCVKLALSKLCTRQPDMVIGGINHGDNASVNTHYSGTMGVAREGAMKYIPSVAFSLCVLNFAEEADFEPMRGVVRGVVERVLREGLPRFVCLNVNVPLGTDIKGVKMCRMAWGRWVNEVETQRHPRGYDNHWLVGEYANDEPEATDTDNWALTHGYAAITPTRIDITDHDTMTLWQDFNV